MTYHTDAGFNVAIQRPSIIARIAAAFELRKQRKTLGSLTETQLNDIGLTFEDVAAENAKSLWV